MMKLRLGKPTNRTNTGPHFSGDVQRVVVKYDYEHDNGAIEWQEVVFNEVLHFNFGSASCCAAEDIVGATEVACLNESELLRVTLKKWQESIGWQDWQQQQGGSARFRHFKMYFDDAACLDVIAATCEVLVQSTTADI
ncbi:MAG: hypothetical protein ACRERD_33355 [Candidatus Binatia bacterium]